AAPAAAGAAARQATAPQCLSLGPFETAAEIERARAALRPIASLQVRGRRVQTGPISGWRVYLPPSEDLAAAQAAAARVAEAGFTDYFVMRQGADANAVALGRYADEATARAHAAALAAAGFAALAEPIRSGPVALWLDLRAAAGFDPARAQEISAAPRREALDCAELQ
ncbi:SPOR domain-containing protein, partial [Lysobacter sp. D1-1-M9]